MVNIVERELFSNSIGLFGRKGDILQWYNSIGLDTSMINLIHYVGRGRKGVAFARVLREKPR